MSSLYNIEEYSEISKIIISILISLIIIIIFIFIVDFFNKNDFYSLKNVLTISISSIILFTFINQLIDKKI